MKRFGFFLLLALSACGDAGSFDAPLNIGGAGGLGGGFYPNTGGDGGTVGSSPCRGVLCDDGDPCTEDQCQPATGECEFRTAIDGTACDFEAGPGLCVAGVCEDAGPCAEVVCDDGLECTEDVCDRSDGSCTASFVLDGRSCAHGAGQCLSGECIEPRWGQPMSFGVRSPAGSIVPRPLAEADASGRTVAVSLAQRSDRSWTVAARHHAPTTGWGPLQPIAGSNKSDADAIDLAVNENGEAVAIWMLLDTPPSIYANRYAPGTGWGAPVRVENDRELISKDPQVAIDPSGHVIAVWLRAGRVYARHFRAADGWGSPQLIGLDAEGGKSPRVGFDADGNAMVVWFQRNELYAARFTADLGWQPPERIASASSLSGAPELAVSPRGDAVLLWIARDGNGQSLYAKVYSPATDWGGSWPLEQGSGSVFLPRVAIDPNGNAMAVWDQLTKAGRQVFASRYAVGGTWGPAWPLEEEGLVDAAEPMVAMDAEGRALALWTQSDASQEGLRASRFLPELGWQAPERIAPLSSELPGLFSPWVCTDAEGRALAFWVVLRRTGQYEVWSSRFE